MTDYPYDPDLPFVVTIGGLLFARVKSESIAAEIAHGHLGFVVDTTPTPKIPANAEFIHWTTPSNTQYYAKRLGHPNNKVWLQDSGRNYDEDDLIEVIGDAEVVVLKRA